MSAINEQNVNINKKSNDTSINEYAISKNMYLLPLVIEESLGNSMTSIHTPNINIETEALIIL